MNYFFIYLLIFIVNIFAVLAVIKFRKNNASNSTTVSDAELIENEVPRRTLGKKSSFSLFNSQRNQREDLFIGYEEVSAGMGEVVYDGQLLDLAVQKKIVKKKGNWYLYGDEKLGYGKDKAKFYLLENPQIATEISNYVYNIIDVKEEKNNFNDIIEADKSVNSGTQLYQTPNSIENQRSVNLLNQQFEVELAEVYVKSNTLKKILENAIGTEVMISIDISQRFNPLMSDKDEYIREVVSMLKEVDYLTSAVENISRNARYLGIDVTEQLLREKLELLTSNRFSIVFTKKPVAKHTSIPKLQFGSSLKKNRSVESPAQNVRTQPRRERRKNPLFPLGVALLLVGFFIVIYSINQVFFSTSVIIDEQNLLQEKFNESSVENIFALRDKNLALRSQEMNLENTGEFQESFISIASKTLTNQAAKAEFLPDVVGRLTILSANINHYVVFGASIDQLQYGPGFILGTSLPGNGGNFAIAGHRTTYGAPFGDLDKVNIGDNIFFQTNSNQYKYLVVDKLIVQADENYVLENFGDDRITLSTCHPKFSAKQRLIVVGQLERVEVFES